MKQPWLLTFILTRETQMIAGIVLAVIGTGFLIAGVTIPGTVLECQKAQAQEGGPDCTYGDIAAPWTPIEFSPEWHMCPGCPFTNTPTLPPPTGTNPPSAAPVDPVPDPTPTPTPLPNPTPPPGDPSAAPTATGGGGDPINPTSPPNPNDPTDPKCVTNPWLVQCGGPGFPPPPPGGGGGGGGGLGCPPTPVGSATPTVTPSGSSPNPTQSATPVGNIFGHRNIAHAQGGTLPPVVTASPAPSASSSDLLADLCCPSPPGTANPVGTPTGPSDPTPTPVGNIFGHRNIAHAQGGTLPPLVTASPTPAPSSSSSGTPIPCPSPTAPPPSPMPTGPTDPTPIPPSPTTLN